MFIDDAENKQDPLFIHKGLHFLEPEPPVRTLNNDIYALVRNSPKPRQLNDMEKSLQLLWTDI